MSCPPACLESFHSQRATPRRSVFFVAMRTRPPALALHVTVPTRRRARVWAVSTSSEAENSAPARGLRERAKLAAVNESSAGPDRAASPLVG